jgi:hypothetical protein
MYEARKLLETERENTDTRIKKIEKTVACYEKVTNQIDNKAKQELETIQNHTRRIIQAIEQKESTMKRYKVVQAATRSKFFGSKR